MPPSQRRLLPLLSLLLAGCAVSRSRPPLSDEGFGGGSAAVSCSFEAPPPSPPEGCGAAGQPCADGAACVDDRCYRPIGAPPSYPPDIMAGLHDSPIGERCIIAEGGVLDRVEAPLWADGDVLGVTMVVYVSCGDRMIEAARTTLPASALPTYGGEASDQKATTFSIDPPLRIEPGATVTALFHAQGASRPDAAIVHGVHRSDVAPDCEHALFDTVMSTALVGDPFAPEAPPGCDEDERLFPGESCPGHEPRDFMARFYLR